MAACRTAIGTSFKGTLSRTPAGDLATTVVEEVVRRSTLPVEVFDDLVLGEVMQGGGDLARYVALTAGLPSVSGLAHQRQCASSLSAVQTAAAGIRAGMDNAIIAGGAESISTAPKMFQQLPDSDEPVRWMPPSHPATPETPADDMSITVGWNTARLAGISREDMDAWALRSHQRAVAAIDAGHFTDQIVPVEVAGPDGNKVLFEVDEHPRRNTTLERLGGLKPLHPEIDGFSITAGNSSGINDAAAALVLTSDTLAAERGLSPLGVVRSWASVGVDPLRTGLAPIEAIPKALKRAGLSLSDVALFEINEAFAAVPIAACRELDLDPEIVNISGSGCSLGHPVAATGARMITTLLSDLRRRGGGIGVAALCAGGGMASAIVVETV
ncbi:acetyl-CoA acetyltransferase [Nocardia jinanensis]|uniref:Probable acetyl-CoA acetyltransferase n=1 Tax=Nocardia jinanensis TaxID=382504 RepID=A0A917RL84_9NOCA|nr:acetyl-CoA acetyltransferase [Nocardia jinanensis]